MDILDLHLSFVGHDGSRQAVQINEHGIVFADKNRLATQELIFVAQFAEIARNFFNYKLDIIAKQRANPAQTPTSPTVN